MPVFINEIDDMPPPLTPAPGLPGCRTPCAHDPIYFAADIQKVLIILWPYRIRNAREVTHIGGSVRE
jgi:hypothetical protein